MMRVKPPQPPCPVSPALAVGLKGRLSSGLGPTANTPILAYPH